MCRATVLILLLVSCGCETPVNPSFHLSVDEAERAMVEMRAQPVALERPLVVIAGHNDPGISAPYFKRTFGAMTNSAIIVELTPAGSTFDEDRKQLIDAVERACPSGKDGETVEVDVVALSMGGLVARYTAVGEPLHLGKRLKIARLFTLSSPHRGAKLASLPTFSRLQKDMQPGSEFLRSLPRPEYPVYAYVRLNDEIVGQENAALEGEYPWWVPNRPLENAHLSCFCDPRLLADIARRLRGEAGYATWPPAGFPE